MLRMKILPGSHHTIHIWTMWAVSRCVVVVCTERYFRSRGVLSVPWQQLDPDQCLWQPARKEFGRLQEPGFSSHPAQRASVSAASCCAAAGAERRVVLCCRGSFAPCASGPRCYWTRLHGTTFLRHRRRRKSRRFVVDCAEVFDDEEDACSRAVF